MANTQALILAAGRGSRLGEASGDLPKCLLQVGNATLIEHQLAALGDAGVGPVGMVIGYRADDVKEAVGMQAEYLLNPRWNVTNSLYSFWLARDWVSGSVMLLNSDVLVHPDVIERLLAASGDVLAVDSSSGEGGEQMKVSMAAGRVLDMSKQMLKEEVFGENLGIIKLSHETAEVLFGMAAELVDAGQENEWLSSAIRELARKRPLGVVDMAGLPWVEVDFPVDLNRARKVVWPAIQRSLRRQRWPARLLRWTAATLVVAALVGGARYGVPEERRPDKIWEVLPANGGAPVQIKVRGRSQAWSLMRDGESIEFAVEGPGSVRLETRMVTTDKRPAAFPYVLEVSLDGKRQEWILESARPSKKATHPQWRISHKREEKLKFPEGSHTLGIRLVASSCDGNEVLVRVRQLEIEESEESEE